MNGCPVCKSERIAVALDGLTFHGQAPNEDNLWRYRLLRCAECGLAFVDPEPSWGRLCSFYESYAIYNSSDHDPIGGRQSWKYRVAKWRYATYATQTFHNATRCVFAMACEYVTGRTVSFTLGIPIQLPLDARILEIGYGSGTWLLSMRKLGYRCLWGHDIDANHRNVSRLEANDIRISTGDLVDVQLPDVSFDCIRMEHVFEHLRQPHKVLVKCHSILKPGGILVLNFPSIDSWLAFASLGRYPALELPRHLYHHTSTSARLLLESAGFCCRDIKHYGVALQLAAFCAANLAYKSPLRQLANGVFRLLAPFWKLFCEVTRKGEFITVLCKRGTG